MRNERKDSRHTGGQDPFDTGDEHSLAGVREDMPPRFVCFEDWLASQEEEQDESGDVARFVLADIAKGCWPHSELGCPFYHKTYEELGDEFEEHLVRVHAFPRSSTQTFRRVYEAYRQERNPATSANVQDQVSEVLLYTMFRWDDPVLPHPVKHEPVAPGTRRELRRMISDYTHGNDAVLSDITQCIVEQLGLTQEYHRELAPMVAKEIRSQESLGWHGFLPF